MSRELCEAVDKIMREGARCRADGTINPYPVDTVQALLHAEGWLREDLRLALIKAAPGYAISQRGRDRWFDRPEDKA